MNTNITTNSYNVSVTGSGTKSLVYDLNGNLTGDGTKTYEWDPLNRLTAINNGTLRSEFTYNGLSQRVKIIEKDNGTVTMTRNLVWVGSEICEARNGTNNNVQRRYYPQGMQMNVTNFYYTRDHLGSIRELTDSTGAIVTRYDYDPYGRRTRLTGTTDADFGFTGHYHHKPSSLALAQYRAYSADFGRWISRDPIGEAGGINLYGYVRNNPFRYIDTLGLDPFIVTGILRVDDDGEGPSHNDPFHNSVTPGSDIPNGPHVNADIDAYVASTPAARKAGVEIGDPADLITNGRTVHCKVGDSRTSEGTEASVKAVQDAGLTVIDGKRLTYIPSNRRFQSALTEIQDAADSVKIP